MTYNALYVGQFQIQNYKMQTEMSTLIKYRFHRLTIFNLTASNSTLKGTKNHSCHENLNSAIIFIVQRFIQCVHCTALADMCLCVRICYESAETYAVNEYIYYL